LISLNCQDKKKIDRTFLVHGEYETQKNYALKLQDEGFDNIEIPGPKQEYTL
jgi:metallo-beta-lactamase family protein